MGIFNLGKKENKKAIRFSSKQDNENIQAEDCCGEIISGICCVKVLGSGCKSCHALYENAKQSIATAGIDIDVEYITDFNKIAEYGVMSMPALVINNKVVSAGKVLKANEILPYLQK